MLKICLVSWKYRAQYDYERYAYKKDVIRQCEKCFAMMVTNNHNNIKHSHTFKNRGYVEIFLGIWAMPILPSYLLKKSTGIPLLHLYPLRISGSMTALDGRGQ